MQQWCQANPLDTRHGGIMQDIFIALYNIYRDPMLSYKTDGSIYTAAEAEAARGHHRRQQPVPSAMCRS